jgi:hypothetical protein
LKFLRRHVGHVGIPLPPPPRRDDLGLGRVSLPDFAFRTIAGPAIATAFRFLGGGL